MNCVPSGSRPTQLKRPQSSSSNAMGSLSGFAIGEPPPLWANGKAELLGRPQQRHADCSARPRHSEVERATMTAAPSELALISVVGASPDSKQRRLPAPILAN